MCFVSGNHRPLRQGGQGTYMRNLCVVPEGRHVVGAGGQVQWDTVGSLSPKLDPGCFRSATSSTAALKRVSRDNTAGTAFTLHMADLDSIFGIP